MSQILSSQELYVYLNNFRQTVDRIDYLQPANLIFFNLESIYSYMETINNNYFKKQYKDLQNTLDCLEPYLPFLSSQRAKDFLIQISTINDDKAIEELKSEYTSKLRMDFINATRNVKSEKDWYCIVQTCEEIRARKEETYLH